MSEISKNIEWCIYDMDHNDYSFSINKETLNQIKNWEEFRTTMYYSSSQRKSLEDIQQRMRKNLIIWLLSDEERRKNMTDALVKNYKRESEEVIMNISNRLLENLLEFEWWYPLDEYEYRYNMRWDKMYFYMNDSYNRQWLNNNIDFYNQFFNQRFPKEEK